MTFINEAKQMLLLLHLLLLRHLLLLLHPYKSLVLLLLMLLRVNLYLLQRLLQLLLKLLQCCQLVAGAVAAAAAAGQPPAHLKEWQVLFKTLKKTKSYRISIVAARVALQQLQQRQRSRGGARAACYGRPLSVAEV